MRITDFFRLLLKNWALLLLLPFSTAVAIFFFTKNNDKEYTSDTVIYTGVTSDISIKNDNNSNYFATSKAFANLLSLINSRETKQEVALTLLAQHIMMEEFDPNLISWNTHKRLQELISKPLRHKLKGNTIEETTYNLTQYLHENNNNVIFQLLHSEEPGYSLKALTKINAYQVGGSDLMKVEFSSNDPAMCRLTLEILSRVFIRKHKDLMSGQNETVLKYFKEATAEASKRLEIAEQKFLDFHKTNSIINYEEQASNIQNEKQNLLQQYNKLELQYAGAVSALNAIEENLEKRGSTILQNQEIISLRDQLAKVKTEISDLESFRNSKSSNQSQEKLAALKQKAASIEGQIRTSMENYAAKTASVKGVASKDLLNQWIKNAVQVEEMKGQLTVMRKQNQSFGLMYEKVAPLGADLKKIEREIEMAEKEYFSLLNGLGQSQLTQQNIELTSQIKVVDPAFIPVKANSSKRLLLVISGAAGIFILILAILILSEVSFPTLKNTYLASKFTGFSILGTLPIINKKNDKHLHLMNHAEEQLALQLILKKQSLHNPDKPFVVGVISSLSGEGKTTVVSSLTRHLYALGLEVFSLFPASHGKKIKYGGNILLYNPLKGISQQVNISEISERNINGSAIAIIEFPALLESTYPVALIQQLDLIILTVRADRTWKQADKKIVSRLKAITNKPIELVLNGVRPDNLEEFPTVKLRPLSKEIPEDQTATAKENWQGNIALNA